MDPEGATFDVVRASLDADADSVSMHSGLAPVWAFTLADLLAEDAWLLTAQQRQWFINEPWSPPERFSAFVGSVARMTLVPTLAVLRHHHQVPEVDFADLHFDLDRAAEGRLGVWWPEQITLIEVKDVERALTALVAQMIDFMTPLIKAMGPRVRVGPHKLWAQVVDAFTGCRPRYSDPIPQADRAFWETFRRIARDTVLDQGDSVVEIPHQEGGRQMVRATACCFVYKQRPVIGGAELYPWSNGRWAGYCMVCPIIPTQESIARASYVLNRPSS